MQKVREQDRLWSVSYTHLDVYKRQLIFGFAAKDGQKAVNEPLPANKEGLGLTSIINVLGSDYRSIYSVDRKTQQVSMYLESKNADEMTRMKDTIYTSAITSYVKENVLPQDQMCIRDSILIILVHRQERKG